MFLSTPEDRDTPRHGAELRRINLPRTPMNRARVRAKASKNPGPQVVASATPRRTLAPAHQQPYQRPVDEQPKQSGRDKQRDATCIGQHLALGDSLTYHAFLRRRRGACGGRALARGRGLTRGGLACGGRGRYGSGLTCGSGLIRSRTRCGSRCCTTRRASGLTCARTCGVLVIELRKTDENLILADITDLLGYLG